MERTERRKLGTVYKFDGSGIDYRHSLLRSNRLRLVETRVMAGAKVLIRRGPRLFSERKRVRHAPFFTLHVRRVIFAVLEESRIFESRTRTGQEG